MARIRLVKLIGLAASAVAAAISVGTTVAESWPAGSDTFHDQASGTQVPDKGTVSSILGGVSAGTLMNAPLPYTKTKTKYPTAPPTTSVLPIQ